MRKLIIIILTLITFNINAQQFLGAFSFGGNLTQVDGDEIYGFKKIGFNAGAAAFYPFTDKWFASVEIQFAQKGSYQKYPFNNNPTKSLPYYKLRLDYLEVPMMVHFLDKRILMIGAGLKYGRLVGVKEIEWGENSGASILSGPYSQDDWSWLIDVRVPLKNRLKLNFRYSYSINKIRTRTYTNLAGEEWTREQFNNVITLRLTYVFNEKIEETE